MEPGRPPVPKRIGAGWLGLWAGARRVSAHAGAATFPCGNESRPVDAQNVAPIVRARTTARGARDPLDALLRCGESQETRESLSRRHDDVQELRGNRGVVAVTGDGDERWR